MGLTLLDMDILSRNITDGQWHHVVGVSKGTTIDIFVDGVLDTANLGNTHAVQAKTGLAYIGYDDFALSLVGILQDVAIYNRALTPAEILDHYNLRLA